jgi:cytochrome b561
MSVQATSEATIRAVEAVCRDAWGRVVAALARETGDLAGEVHEISAFLLVALILVHAGAALKHQFVDRWRGSARMPPFSSQGEPVAIGQGRNVAPQED